MKKKKKKKKNQRRRIFRGGIKQKLKS